MNYNRAMYKNVTDFKKFKKKRSDGYKKLLLFVDYKIQAIIVAMCTSKCITVSGCVNIG